VFQFENLCATDDAAQWQNTLSDCRLDRLDKTESTNHTMSTRISLHRRLRRHTDDALQQNIIIHHNYININITLLSGLARFKPD